jgi:TRAP-type uncharacterized transport system fused permease subunit
MLALFYTMVASLVLGCGLPATAVYIVLATLAAPALINIGILPLAAHLFVFYFGIISTITPPVALTAYAAAGIGGANPTKVGISAFIMGIAAYIVPFMFTFSPTLLMQGPVLNIIFSFITAIFGIYMVASGGSGYLFSKLNILQRVIIFSAGIMLIKPGFYSDIIGLITFGIISIMSFLNKKKALIAN